jgi:hypothetical protein
VTYYDVLGVPRDASPTVIKRAYVELARRHHPDFHTTDPVGVRAANEKAMQAVNEAWSVLSDPVARRRYDERLSDGADDGAPHDHRRTRAEEDARARAAWRPFDEGDDDIDPRLLEDEPTHVVVTRRRQLVTVAPAITFFGGVFTAIIGLVINVLPLAVLGIAAVVVAALGFVVLPLLALSASARNDRR